jgi:hypothetical protein
LPFLLNRDLTQEMEVNLDVRSFGRPMTIYG